MKVFTFEKFLNPMSIVSCLLMKYNFLPEINYWIYKLYSSNFELAVFPNFANHF